MPGVLSTREGLTVACSFNSASESKSEVHEEYLVHIFIVNQRQMKNCHGELFWHVTTVNGSPCSLQRHHSCSGQECR